VVYLTYNKKGSIRILVDSGRWSRANEILDNVFIHQNKIELLNNMHLCSNELHFILQSELHFYKSELTITI
jgi:hypothetical protein